ncbi:response regulator transcription factor [Taibaiella koreensis]|uniref:response regulator transcription factor n=1 Tax=Taibaiella koreensis TaxID=1268548 RepID=UPI000E59D2A6|nr:response regulator transcription factor [Taibaiella koreensis]
MKVLIIEDEKELADSIIQYLDSEQFSCDLAGDFDSAMEKVYLNEYSCIVLDITLPRGNGLDILKALKREQKEDGVLIISARDSLEDKITGLKLGADDYLAKPFHLAELGARVAAIIRRKSFGGKSQVVIDHLILDLNDRTLKHDGVPISLTRKEYDLLLYFVSNKNKVVTKEAIVEHLWGEEAEMAGSYDFIYSHIKNLRKKLMQAGCPDYIKAVYGMGYKFAIPH